jgi:hypothetical protein
MFFSPAAPGRGAARSFALSTLGADFALAILSLVVANLVEAKDSALTIWGTSPASVLATKSYSFQPHAADANRDRLTFSIRNRPSWAGFDSHTGRLYGTPARWNAGTYKNITIYVSDGKLSAALAPFGLKVVALIDRSPLISGRPPSSVNVGQRYVFQPSASDPDGDRITFSVNNKPSWLSLNAKTGQLQGVPNANSAGTYRNIVLSASDGYSSRSLPAFSISVAAPRPVALAADSSVTLSWIPPTQNLDSTVLTNLAGYRLHYGPTATSLTQLIDIDNPGLTLYVVDNMPAGKWFFALTAYTRDGRESGPSAMVSTVVH